MSFLQFPDVFDALPTRILYAARPREKSSATLFSDQSAINVARPRIPVSERAPSVVPRNAPTRKQSLAASTELRPDVVHRSAMAREQCRPSDDIGP